MSKNMENFGFVCWQNILAYMYEQRQDNICKYCIHQISVKINITNSHTSKIISFLEQKKIITRTKTGRKNVIKFTDNGLKLAEHCFMTQKMVSNL